MKIIKIIFFSTVVVVLLASAALFIFLKTFDINKFKPRIIDQISGVIGRRVNIDSLSLRISPKGGVFVGIHNLKIGDDPKFSSEDFIVVKDINLGVNLMKYAREKSIEVSSVLIKNPKINIIRDENGQINAATIKAPVPPKASRSTEEDRFFGFTALAYADSVSAASTIPLVIRTLTLTDGTVIYQDRMLKPIIRVDITKIALQANDVSLTNSFHFTVDASVFSPKDNIHGSGLAEVDIDNSGIRFKDMNITSDLSDIALKDMVRSLPILESAGLQESLKGKLQVAVGKMDVGAKGLGALSFDGKLEDGRVKIKSLPVAADQITLDFEGTEKILRVKGSSLNLGQGTVKTTGQIDDYLATQAFDFKTQWQGLSLAELNPAKNQPIGMEGQINGQYHIKGQGLSGSPEMLASLIADGEIQVNNGKVVGINILKTVFDKMSMLPGLSEKLEANLPEKYKKLLQEKDTPLKKVDLSTKLQNKHILLDRVQIETDAFLLSTQGQVSFNQELDIRSSLAINADLSKAMVASVEGLQYILDDSGRIVIPVIITGTVPQLSFLPDLQYLGEKIIISQGREQLEKVLDKALEGIWGDSKSSESTQPAGQATQPDPSTQEKKKRPEQELLEGVLDSIFKK